MGEENEAVFTIDGEDSTWDGDFDFGSDAAGSEAAVPAGNELGGEGATPADKAGAGENTPAADAATPPQEGNEDRGGGPKAEPLFTVTYDHKEMQLTEAQMKDLAQKGLNYDRLQARQQQKDPSVQLLEQYAQDSGMSVAQYLERVEQATDNAQVQQLVADGAMTEDAARRHVDMQKRLARQEAADKAAATAAAAEREKVSAFVALVEKHPDVKTLPPEVAAAIDQGAAPLAAYESYLLAQKLGEKDAEIGKLQTELAALKADKNNRTTAPGSAKGMAEEPEDNNPLWRGWDSV